jgi:heme oxygenase
MEGYEENVLPRLGGVVNNLQQTRASTLIIEDLQYIGYELPVDIAPANFVLANNMTVPYALGFMYVMEGSKLGGKVIFKHIQSTLGFSADWGARFISDYGNNTGIAWREFLTLLSTHVNDNGGEAEAIAGAKFCFSSIYEFFESNSLVYEN